jgi:predicted alpha/beta hydrolase
VNRYGHTAMVYALRGIEEERIEQKRKMVRDYNDYYGERSY